MLSEQFITSIARHCQGIAGHSWGIARHSQGIVRVCYHKVSGPVCQPGMEGISHLELQGTGITITL